jgi:hypothetical protein
VQSISLLKLADCDCDPGRDAPLAPGFYHKINGQMTTTQFSSSFCMARQTAEIPDFPAFLEMVLE